MAMGKRRTISGDEVDVVYGRHRYHYLKRPGAASEIKRRMRRRERHEGKAEALSQV